MALASLSNRHVNKEEILMQKQEGLDLGTIFSFHKARKLNQSSGGMERWSRIPCTDLYDIR